MRNQQHSNENNEGHFPTLFDVDETRMALGGIGTTTLYEIFKRGEIKPLRIGRRTFVPGTEIKRFLDKRLGEDLD